MKRPSGITTGNAQVMEQAKDQTNNKESVEALVLHAKIERMSRHVGRVAIVIFVVCVVASIASRFFKPALWY